MNRKNIYKLHRKLSIIIAFPVLIWAMSGFIHPIMSNIRPRISTQQTPNTHIDISTLKVPLAKALKENSIDKFYNCRIIHLADHAYYQINKNADDQPVYLSAQDGKQLTDGDKLYAISLANHFASDKKLDVQSAKLITDYTNDYNRINRLLPVWCVKFKRNDGITIYVSTQQSRFSFATNNTRSFLTQAFTLLHTWSWMGNLSLPKIIVISVLMLLTFINGLLGLYIFLTTNSKKSKGNQTLKRRRNHRFTAAFASLFTLFFSFSGGVHTLAKLNKDNSGKVIITPKFSQAESNVEIKKVVQIINQPIKDFSFVKMNNQTYLRVILEDKNYNSAKDLMKQMHVEKPDIRFLKLPDYILIPDGEKLYAEYLAANYLHQEIQSSKTTEISAFDDNYNFSDKVLPVWKVQSNSKTIYVETATNKLRKQTNSVEKFDDYSFAFFHKHEFMMFAGKTAKDISTMFWVAAQIVMIVFGLILYFKRKKQVR